MKKKSYRVGITIALKKGDSIYSNGIRQNGLMLAKLLKLAGHKVTLINFIGLDKAETNYPWTQSEYKTVNIHDNAKYPAESLDVLIHLQTMASEEETVLWKKMNPNLKIVSYKCGNSYVNDMEDILFKARDTYNNLNRYDTKIDAIWYVPQQKENNHDYFSILHRIDAHPIPFVWDPMFLEMDLALADGAYYEPKEGAKRISIFEPNINIVKYTVPSVLAIEHAYRQRPDLIGFMYASNTNHLLDINLFKSMMNQMDIVKDKKAMFTSRYKIVHYLKTNTDIVMSHQWANPLNYLYLDAVYLGYPLVHNAEMFADVGYYYEHFNLKDAAAQLINAAENHDANFEAYKKDVAEKIYRYMPENKRLQQEYTMLLDSLFDDKIKNYISWDWDWKTNLYK